MSYKVSGTMIKPMVTIPLSEYKELVSIATRFELLKSEIAESMYSDKWEQRICNIPKKYHDSLGFDKTENENEN